MGIYRCNKCGTVAEHNYMAGMDPVACKKCGNMVAVYDTPFFVQKLLERYMATVRELKALQAVEAEQEQSDSPEVNHEHGGWLEEDIHNSSALANAEQHKPIANWLAAQNAKAVFDYSAVDMSGYFDEAAQSLGEHYALTEDLLGKINWSYRKKHTGLNVDLGKMSQKDGQALNQLCRQFYSHTLFAGYFYQKQDKVIRLKLQRASKIENFFSGAWLEWFALNILLQQAQEKGKNYSFSCARNVKLEFANEDVHELDVVWLSQRKTPVIVECKSGEFRRDIEKYIRLRKRLNVSASHFIILATDIEDMDSVAMSSMYELTFLNIKGFGEYIARLL